MFLVGICIVCVCGGGAIGQIIHTLLLNVKYAYCMHASPGPATHYNFNLIPITNQKHTMPIMGMV